MDLFDLKTLSLILNNGVDAIGLETDFTIEKDWKSGHNVVAKWLLKHSNKKMIFKNAFGLLNFRSPTPTH